MGKPIERDFTQSKGILKFFPYEGAACIVPQTMVTSADANGKKIAKAGTPFPSNDASCKGYLLEDGLMSSIVSFSSSFFLLVACFDLLALAENLAIKSCNSFALASAFLLASFC